MAKSSKTKRSPEKSKPIPQQVPKVKIGKFARIPSPPPQKPKGEKK